MTDPTAFDGRSDYGAFIANGVPAGGLFSGAEGIKTAAQEARYGGFAGLAYDPCYHQACDDVLQPELHVARPDERRRGSHHVGAVARSRTPVAERSATSAAKKKSKRMNRHEPLEVQGELPGPVVRSDDEGRLRAAPPS